MSDIVSFGEWVQKRRNQLGLSRPSLAHLVGCSPETIKKIERDERRPSVQIAELLSANLQIPDVDHENFMRRARGEFVPGLGPLEEMSLAKVQTPADDTPKHNLPPQTTSFIGREADLATLGGFLTNPESRLITIVGPGGMGKTRLALALAERFLGGTPDSASLPMPFPHGVFFVDMAPLSHHEQIIPALAEALNYQFQAGDRGQEQQVLDYLRTRQMLLLFDNFEHLLAGVDFLVDILQAAPKIQILVTSREWLQLRAEQVYAIEGLAYPEGKTSAGTEAYTAVQFFLQAARRSQHDFELDDPVDLIHLTDICRTVAGMPLALELAASWVDMLSLAQIAIELQQGLDFLETDMRDMPARHRSVRAAIDYSWQKLDEGEQAVFAKLSVFRGGFTWQAAQAVAEANLRQLARLVSKSFLQGGGKDGRYQIHELLRQYGNEKLNLLGEEEQTRGHHLVFFLKLAQEAEIHIESGDHLTWLRLLELENSNLRAALDWCRVAVDKGDNGLRLVGALTSFWAIRSNLSEGRAYFTSMLANVDESTNPATYAKALLGAGTLAIEQGDLPAARPLLEECLSIYRKLEPEDHAELSEVLVELGLLESEEGNYATAATLQEEALFVFREKQDLKRICRTLRHLGWIAIRRGDFALADRYFAEALPLTKKVGSDHLSILLLAMGESALRQDDFENAALLHHQCLAMFQDSGYKFGVAAAMGNLAWLSIRTGELQQGLTLLRESLNLRREIGDVAGGTAWCLEKMAEVALLLGQRGIYGRKNEAFHRAAQLFGAAESLRKSTGAVMDLVDWPDYEQHVIMVKKQLGETRFSIAWNEGSELDYEEMADSLLAEVMTELGWGEQINTP